MNIIKPRRHQAKAVSAAIEAFRTRDRATIVMPCGTGKTLIGPWVAEGLESRVVVIFVPSLWLLRQTVGQWAATTEWKDAEFFGVCSDKSVFDDLDISEITETRITTSPAVIRDYFNSLNGGKHVVCCTYQSAGILAEAIPEGFHFDFGIFDEAHCTAGEAYVGLSFGGFSVPLLDRHVPIRKRLFITATPRSYAEKHTRKEGENRYFSMDDTELYGERVYELTFAEAVARGLVADYRIIISVITKQDVTRELLLSNSSDIEAAANALALKAACKKYGIRKSILFFNTIDECAAFSSGPIQEVWQDVLHTYISSRMAASQRSEVMNLLGSDQDISVSNARCLTMGIDVPAVDMVAFMRRKRGEIDIVQAIGRASRKDPNHPDKIGFVFLPLFLDDASGEELSDAVNMSGYEQIWTVLEAMRAGDGRFDSWIRLSRAEISKNDPLWTNAKCGDKIIVEAYSQGIDTETIKKSIDAKIIDRLGETWDEMFGRLFHFWKEQGHSNVIRSYKDKVLAQWVAHQRIKRERLSAKRRELLLSIEFDFNPLGTKWMTMFERLISFKALNGHCNITGMHKDRSLFNWVCNTRQDWDISVTQKRKELLLGIGFDPDPLHNGWNLMVEKLKKFKEEHGHCNVPVTYIDKRLATWVRAIRQRWKNVYQERKELLLSIGFDQSPQSSTWNIMFNKLSLYKSTYGHSNVPQSYKDRSLARWVYNQRKNWGDLSDSHRGLLLSVDFDPTSWKDKLDKSWNDMFTLLKQFNDEHGHTNVPNRYNNNPPLSNWVGKQRSNWNTLNFNKRSMLLEIGFDPDPLNSSWSTMFDRLIEFKIKYNHCNVTRGFSDHALVNWLRSQRMRWERLTPTRKKLLVDLGVEPPIARRNCPAPPSDQFKLEKLASDYFK